MAGTGTAHLRHDVVLSVTELVVEFPARKKQVVHAVSGVSFDLDKGETLGIVGESGCGKTTTGRAIMQLESVTSGSIRLNGVDLAAEQGEPLRQARKAMQMIFQDPYSSLNPRMTVGEIVAEGLRLHAGVSNAMARERVAEWLGRVGLQPDHMSRYPHEFSGGQRQRIGIARALILEPDFVVCDEPISALDVSVQAQVINLLGELKESMGLTLLFIAHDLSMVRYVSDRMAVMYLGSLVEIGRADELYFDPKHPYTEVLIGSNPEPDPQLERRRPSTAIQGEIPSPVNVPAGCRFANRCPKVMEVCKTVTPQLIKLKDLDREVACHLYD